MIMHFRNISYVEILVQLQKINDISSFAIFMHRFYNKTCAFCPFLTQFYPKNEAKSE
jgi:hypothetical protein